jgi:hypothetical protein
MLQIAATNTGTQPVTLAGYGLFLPKGGNPVLVQRAALGIGQGRPDRLALPRAHTQDWFPCELKPGQGCKVWVEVAQIARSLQHLGYAGNVELHAYYTDVGDGVYRSNVLPVNVTKKLSQISQPVVTTEPEQAAGELEQREIVRALLLPADQDAPAHR